MTTAENGAKQEQRGGKAGGRGDAGGIALEKWNGCADTRPVAAFCVTVHRNIPLKHTKPLLWGAVPGCAG